jgi:hypothetical protein
MLINVDQVGKVSRLNYPLACLSDLEHQPAVGDVCNMQHVSLRLRNLLGL